MNPFESIVEALQNPQCPGGTEERHTVLLKPELWQMVQVEAGRLHVAPSLIVEACIFMAFKVSEKVKRVSIESPE